MPNDTFQLAIAVQALAARQRVQAIALREALAVLSAPEAAHVRKRIIKAVEVDTERPVMVIPEVDEASADELAGIMGVLVR